MSKKLLTKVRKAFCLALALICFAGTPVMEASAAGKNVHDREVIEVLDTSIMDVPEGVWGSMPSARTMLSNCYIVISFSEEGMFIEMTTGTGDYASVIGIKDIKIEKKVWYGWKTVAVADGGEFYNNNTMGCSVLYANAEYGSTYRVSCVHYADVNGYTEGKNCTGSFVFTY